MRRWHYAVAPLPFAVTLMLTGACINEPSHVVLGLTVPKGLLDGATAELRVIEADAASCDPSTGIVSPSNPPEDSVVSFAMRTDGCAAGAVACADVTLDQDDSERVFEVLGRNSGGVLVARGCTTVVVDQDPLAVQIDIFPAVPPACCNDGAVQISEDCDTGQAADLDCFGNPNGAGQCSWLVQDAVCGCDCRAVEILMPLPVDGPAIGNELNSKIELDMVFNGPDGQGELANSLRSVFTDLTPVQVLTPAHTDTGNINIRVLNGSLYPVADPFDEQLRLPTSCDPVQLKSPFGIDYAQRQPAIDRISSSNVMVAFASAPVSTAQDDFDVFVSLQNGSGCINAEPTDVTAGKQNSLLFPDVAGGPADTALVVWADGNLVNGRIAQASPAITLTPAAANIEVSANFVGVASPRARVAGNESGWVVAYTGNGIERDIFIRTVAPDGSVGAEQKVNLVDAGNQEEPAIAMQPDGSFVVAWKSQGLLYFQRYTSDGPVAGDQDEPLNASSATAQQVQLAAAGNVGNFYTAAWRGDDGIIRARHINGDVDANTPFLRNTVDNLLTEFVASHPAIPTPRSGPAVAIGGSGAGFVAIGYKDDDMTRSGLYVRRFPLPQP